MYILYSILFLILFFVLANRFTRKNPRKLSREQLIEMVESFLQNKDGEYDWDDFITLPIRDPKMNDFRVECAKIDWTTPLGKAKVRELLEDFIG